MKTGRRAKDRVLTVSEIEGLVHVGLHVGGGLLLRHVGESGHLAVKVEELSVGKDGQVILEGTEFLLGSQVGGRGDRVQVGNVLRHVGRATGAVGRHEGRIWAAGARRRRYFVEKSEAAEAGCIGDIKGSLGVVEGRGMVACFWRNEAGSRIGVRPPELQSLGALRHVRNSPRSVARSCSWGCRISAAARFHPPTHTNPIITASSLCQSLLSFVHQPARHLLIRMLLLVLYFVIGLPYCSSLLCCTWYHLARQLAIVPVDVHLPRLVQIELRVPTTPPRFIAAFKANSGAE